MRTLQAAGGAALTTEDAAGTEDVEGVEDAEGVEDGGGTLRSRRHAAGLLAAVAAIAVVADVVTKQLAVASLSGQEPVRLLGGAVYLVYATNSGAAFSLGSDYTFVFPIVAMAVIGWIGWMAWRMRSLPWGVSLGLVLGGAVGNLADRLFRPPGPFRGEVVDMISVFDPYGRVWPVFNIADSVLLVGVILAVWLELTGRRRDGTREPVRQRER